MIEFKVSTDYGVIAIDYFGKRFLPNTKQDNWKEYIQEALHAKFHTPKEKIFSLSQVHGDRFVTSLDLSIELNKLQEADAMISERMDDLLVIRTADCVPIAIWSYDIPLIANIHSGWKGTQLGILEKTYLQMIKMVTSKKVQKPIFGFAIGPRIMGTNYEIGEDVAQFFEGKPGLIKKEGHKSHLDLGTNIQAKIREIAVDPVILDLSESTFGSDNWFSHRKKDTGRNLNCIRMVS